MNAYYSEKVLDHFKNPRNMGEMEDADVVAQKGNPVCGDQMKLYLKIGKKDGKEYIKDVSFQTLGCASAIATTSILTELAKGKTLDEAYKIDRDDIAKALGGLPPIKMHCSVLSQEVLKDAIDKWRSKK
jgi:nitrogen fixation NifU-like protein